MKKFLAIAAALTASAVLTGCAKTIQKEVWVFTDYDWKHWLHGYKDSNSIDDPKKHRALLRACRKNTLGSINKLTSDGIKITGSNPQDYSYELKVRYPPGNLDRTEIVCYAKSYIVEGPESKLNKKLYNEFGDQIIMLR